MEDTYKNSSLQKKIFLFADQESAREHMEDFFSIKIRYHLI